jgi:hypothetical protein
MSVVSRDDLVRAFVSLAVTLLLMGAALFLSAGTLQWPHGLLFLAVFLFLTLVAMAWLWCVNPEIFVARRRLGDPVGALLGVEEEQRPVGRRQVQFVAAPDTAGVRSRTSPIRVRCPRRPPSAVPSPTSSTP